VSCPVSVVAAASGGFVSVLVFIFIGLFSVLSFCLERS
jgi:hypothetical protein